MNVIRFLFMLAWLPVLSALVGAVILPSFDTPKVEAVLVRFGCVRYSDQAVCTVFGDVADMNNIKLIFTTNGFECLDMIANTNGVLAPYGATCRRSYPPLPSR